MTKKPSRLEKAAQKYATGDDFAVSHWEEAAFDAGARWAYRALLRECRRSGFVEHPVLRRVWKRISKERKK